MKAEAGMRTLTGWPKAIARETWFRRRALRAAMARPAQFRVSPRLGRVVEGGAAQRHRCSLGHARECCALHRAFGMRVGASSQPCLALPERGQAHRVSLRVYRGL